MSGEQEVNRQARLRTGLWDAKGAKEAYKQAILQGLELPLDEALKGEREAYGSLIHTRDREEGIKAFMEKRRPEGRGS